MSRSNTWDGVVSDLDQRIYTSLYKRQQPKLQRPALLLVDYYNAVFGDKPEPLPQALKRFPRSCGLAGWQALPSAKRLLDTARSLKIPVFYTKDKFPPNVDTPPTKSRIRKQPTVWDSTIIDPLRPKVNEMVISKSQASGFFSTSLKNHLRKRAINSLIIAGETTSGCVRATVIDAYSYGFKVLLVEEATFDRFSLSHKVNLFDLNCKYAWVVKEKVAISAMQKASKKR